jgi:hypothetical protein
VYTLHQLVGDWGRTTGKRSKTQEKNEKVHRGGEFIGRKESDRERKLKNRTRG